MFIAVSTLSDIDPVPIPNRHIFEVWVDGTMYVPIAYGYGLPRLFFLEYIGPPPTVHAQVHLIGIDPAWTDTSGRPFTPRQFVQWF